MIGRAPGQMTTPGFPWSQDALRRYNHGSSLRAVIRLQGMRDRVRGDVINRPMLLRFLISQQTLLYDVLGEILIFQDFCGGKGRFPWDPHPWSRGLHRLRSLQCCSTLRYPSIEC